MEYSPSVVQITGALDVSTATRWEEDVEEVVRGSPAVVLDLTRVGFVDSAGVRTLFRVLRSAQSRESLMVFVAPRSGAVRRLLDILDLQSAAPLFDNVDAALRTCGRAGRSARPSQAREGRAGQRSSRA